MEKKGHRRSGSAARPCVREVEDEGASDYDVLFRQRNARQKDSTDILTLLALVVHHVLSLVIRSFEDSSLLILGSDGNMVAMVMVMEMIRDGRTACAISSKLLRQIRSYKR